MIDFIPAVKYFRENVRGWDVGISSGVIEIPTKADLRETFESVVCKHSRCQTCTDTAEDLEFDLRRRGDFLSSTPLLHYLSKDQALDRDRRVLLPPRVFGYALLERNWYCLDLENLHPVEDKGRDEYSTKQGFDDLVLPSDYKKLMKALVKNHRRNPTKDGGFEEAEDAAYSTDLVRGKGKGLIILLHGVSHFPKGCVRLG